LPFSSFVTALDQLSQGVPNVIQKDAFPYHSGLLQGKVILALRFFDLIDEKGLPNGDKLERLATQKEIHERKANLRMLLKAGYAHVIRLNLLKMTPSQLDEAFADYGISGDTKKKAKTFFLHAAKFAELDLSPILIRRGRSFAGRKKKTAVQFRAPGLRQDVPENQGSTTSKTVNLKNGGSLTVTLSGNLLDLDSSDRELVFGIMDQIRSHS